MLLSCLKKVKIGGFLAGGGLGGVEPRSGVWGGAPEKF